jgi:UDP-N-acetyl-2-amino-2-deoxyglucuronate dehydrogenase
MIDLAVVGCGRVAEHYAPFIRQLADEKLVSMVYCVDDKNARAVGLAKQFNTSAIVNFDELGSRYFPHLTLVLTPSGLHFSHTRDLLTQKLNVLVEKPCTLRINDAEELKRLALEGNLHLGSVHQNRFNPAMISSKEIIDSRVLGSIITVAVRLRWSREPSYYLDEWHGRWKSDGGVVSQQAFHHLDALHFLLGDVYEFHSRGTRRRHKLEADDTSVGFFELKDGALGTFEFTTALTGQDLEASIEILGTGGVLGIGGVALNQVSFLSIPGLSEPQREKAFRSSQDVPSGYGLGHLPLLRKTIEQISSGGIEPVIPWEDSMRTLKSIHAVYASQETGLPQKPGSSVQSSRLGI